MVMLLEPQLFDGLATLQAAMSQHKYLAGCERVEVLGTMLQFDASFITVHRFISDVTVKL